MRIARVALAAAALAVAIPAFGASAAFADTYMGASSDLAFADTPLQMLSTTKSVTFTNLSASLYLQGLKAQVEGAASDDYFIVGDTCTGTVLFQQGKNCTVRVRFSPTASGPRDATVTVRGSLYDPMGVVSGPMNGSSSLTGTGLDQLAGPQGPTGAAGPAGTNGNTGATGTQGPAGPVGNTGTQGKNGKNGRDGKDGRSAEASKFTGRAACKVTSLRRGSRVACTFTNPVSKRAVLTLHDRRGAVAGAHGNGTRKMTFITARPALGKLSFWAVTGPDAVIAVQRS